MGESSVVHLGIRVTVMNHLIGFGGSIPIVAVTRLRGEMMMLLVCSSYPRTNCAQLGIIWFGVFLALPEWLLGTGAGGVIVGGSCSDLLRFLAVVSKQDFHKGGKEKQDTR
jgi:hypothetical protein